MSRLIVKNLPNSVTEDKVKKTFSSKGGQVTDVQLKFTAEGKFRHFCFIGFRTEDEAEEARKYFDGTFVLGATKISVEVCADLGDKANKPRAWSKYAPDSSAFQRRSAAASKAEKASQEKPAQGSKAPKSDEDSKAKQKSAADELLKKHADDPKFQEFLRIHKRVEAIPGREQLSSKASAALAFDELTKSKETTDEGDQAESDDDCDDDGGDEGDKLANDKKVSDLEYLKRLSGAPEKVLDPDPTAVVAIERNLKKQNSKTVEEKVVKDYFTVKLTGLPYKAKKKDVKKFLAPLKAKSIRVPPAIKGIAYAGFATEKDLKQALATKNKSFMGSCQIGVSKHTVSSLSKARDEKAKAWQEQTESLREAEGVAESGRIFVRNLAYTATEAELEAIFSKFGPLAEINLPLDKDTRKIKGFAFITYVMPENAVLAFNELDGTTFQGRLLHLLPGKPKPEDDVGADINGNGGGSSYKKQKASKDKAQAQSSHNWNTLFLGTSAVADLMAERYGVSKSDVLGTDASSDSKQSAAVRLALGETQVVSDTRSFLEEQGVALDEFSRPPTLRSKTVLLVKNLPAKTAPEEIRDTFSKFGELGRVVLPPAGITAIVEFYEPTEARAAFRRLAYSKFKGTPLYLEWAPEKAFATAGGSRAPPDVNPVPDDSTVKLAQERGDSSRDSVPESGATLFVKNLNFSTTEEALRSHFEKVAGQGVVHSVTIAVKKDAKNPSGPPLSMGYGFVQFCKRAQADSALKAMQHKKLDDHCLELKRSQRAAVARDDDAQNRMRSGSAKDSDTLMDMAGGRLSDTKMVVRNVPFEANAKEVEDIFKTFGSLKVVRLPKKVTGSHRGFAFVEYSTKEEAKKAFEALCHSTHLYGRRLVLEWAEEEATIDDLRRKTAKSMAVSSGGAPAAKRVKKSVILDSLSAGKHD